MLGIPERVYEDCQVKLEKAATDSEESRDDNADSTERGVPLVQYDLTLIRARSRFEGVNTPRNEWNRRLRTKTARSNKHQGQVHPNVCLLYTSPSPRDGLLSRMPSSA